MLAKTLVTVCGALLGFGLAWAPFAYPAFELCSSKEGEFSWLRLSCETDSGSSYDDYYLVVGPFGFFILCLAAVFGAIALRYLYAKLTSE